MIRRPLPRALCVGRVLSTKPEAENWLTLKEARLLEGEWIDPDAGAVLVADYGATWIEERPGLRPRTIRLYRYLLLLLEHATSVDRVVELLYDEVSGCPALRRVDHMGEMALFTRVPQRISTVSPLAEVTLGGNTVWIRTADGRLWLAPELPGHGLLWGYSGSGPHALASRLDRLLDDITCPPVTGNETPPDGLFEFIEATPQDETTTYANGSPGQRWGSACKWPY